MTSKNFVIYLKRRFRRFVGIFSVPSKADVCLSIDLLCHGRLNRNQSMEISWDSFGSVYLLLSAIASVYTVDCLDGHLCKTDTQSWSLSFFTPFI